STYTFNGVQLSSSGTYLDTLTNVVGCDSMVTLNLTVNQPSNTTLIDTIICEPGIILFNGINLFESGTYFDTLRNISNCDSAITLNLTVVPILAGQLYTTNTSGNNIWLNNSFTTLCVGDTLPLYSTLSGGKWTTTGQNLVVRLDSISGLLVARGEGQVRIVYSKEDSNTSCVSTSTFVIRVLGAGILSLSGIDTLCVGTCNCCFQDTTTIRSNITGGTWSSSNPGILAIDSTTGFARALSTGQVWIIYSIKGKCGQRDSIPMFVGTGTNPGRPFEQTSGGVVWFTLQTGSQCTYSRAAGLCQGSQIQVGSSVSGGHWTSSDTSVATIDSNGLVMAVSPGYVTIVYIVRDISGFCCGCALLRLRVMPSPTINGPFRVCRFDTIQYGGNALHGQFLSSQPGVAEISPTTGVLITLAAGTTTIIYGPLDTNQWCTEYARMDVIVDDSYFQEIDTTVCEGLNFNGTVYRVPGTYLIKINNASSGGCDSLYSLKLQINPVPGPPLGFDTTFCYNPSEVGDRLVYPYPILQELGWFTSDTALLPVQVGFYYVIQGNFDVLNLYIAAKEGVCYSAKTKVKIVNDEYLIPRDRPTAFTPNGDLVNDVWETYNEREMELSVFDRWGRLLHRDSGSFDTGTNLYRVQWDGRLNPSSIDLRSSGSYPYKITFKNCTGKEKVWYGTIQLIR
ncbi:MAG: T9SS type B sorting domain-containing protein, partial [Bacteroidetes bacterium]|nr:T9SS type B sorting domain-containing protein [Bacteroidota bacterium]